MLLTASYSESAYLISPGQPLKPRFYKNVIIFLYSRKKNTTKIDLMLLTISYSELVYPITLYSC